jgi:hypothetical protein
LTGKKKKKNSKPRDGKRVPSNARGGEGPEDSSLGICVFVYWRKGREREELN